MRILRCVIAGVTRHVWYWRTNDPHRGLNRCFEVGTASRAKTQGVQNCQYVASIS